MRHARNCSFLALLFVFAMLRVTSVKAECTADISGASQLHEAYTGQEAMDRCMEWSDCEEDCLDQCGIFDPPGHFFDGCDDWEVFPTYIISYGTCICTTEH